VPLQVKVKHSRENELRYLLSNLRERIVTCGSSHHLRCDVAATDVMLSGCAACKRTPKKCVPLHMKLVENSNQQLQVFYKEVPKR
jgi:hypothetical protein